MDRRVGLGSGAALPTSTDSGRAGLTIPTTAT